MCINAYSYSNNCRPKINGFMIYKYKYFYLIYFQGPIFQILYEYFPSGIVIVYYSGAETKKISDSNHTNFNFKLELEVGTNILL